MRILCPHCGERDSGEFAYYGDAAPRRPDGGKGPPNVPAFIDYVYPRDNPAGKHRELWYHVSGCRAWLAVTRDTRTHQIFGVEPVRQALHQAAEGARSA